MVSKILLSLLAAFFLFIGYAFVVMIISIPQGNNPDISLKMEEAKSKGVFVDEPQNNLSEILSSRFDVKPLEVWIECAWIHKGVFPWGDKHVCGNGYRLCVRFAHADMNKLIAAGFPEEWNVVLPTNEDVRRARFSIPDTLTFYYETCPTEPLVFELSFNS